RARLGRSPHRPGAAVDRREHGRHGDRARRDGSHGAHRQDADLLRHRPHRRAVVGPGDGVARWILDAVWSLVGVAAVAAAMIGGTWALRAARTVYHPWYAHPDRLFLMLLA